MDHPLRDLDKGAVILKFAECRKHLEYVRVIEINEILTT